MKDLRPAPVRSGDSILVSLSGGSLILEGRRVTVTDYGHIQLEAGHQYIVFLKVIPETGDYTTEEPDDESFAASDAGLAALRQRIAACAAEEVRHAR